MVAKSPDLITDPLSDLIYKGVGTVRVLGSTIFLLVASGHGILVQVHAAHLFSTQKK